MLPASRARAAPWAAADALSLALITPLIIIGTDARRERSMPTRRQLAEWIATLAFAANPASLIFTRPATRSCSWLARWSSSPLPLRREGHSRRRRGDLGRRGGGGSGPVALVRGSAADQVLVLQLFLGTCFVMGLPVAAVLANRKAALSALAVSRDLSARSSTILARSS